MNSSCSTPSGTRVGVIDTLKRISHRKSEPTEQTDSRRSSAPHTSSTMDEDRLMSGQ